MGLLCGGAGAVNSVTGPGIRPAESDDLARLVELNNAAVPAVNYLTLDEMARFLRVAHRFLVAEVPEDGTVTAFLVGLPADQVPPQSTLSLRWMTLHPEQHWTCSDEEHNPHIS